MLFYDRRAVFGIKVKTSLKMNIQWTPSANFSDYIFFI
jgi:hypothetical protein